MIVGVGVMLGVSVFVEVPEGFMVGVLEGVSIRVGTTVAVMDGKGDAASGGITEVCEY